ncbi:MAG: hypothetical protein HZA54_14180 [Planctomycetes bacterium]|nr:hypothetical protein [Planctomycetota bacterium]
MRAIQRLSLLGVAVLALLAGGCIQMEQAWTVYPDGSGTVKINATMSTQMPGMPGAPPGGLTKDSPQVKEMMKQNDPFKDFEGLYVPPSQTKSEFKDGKMVMTGTAYFEDITKVTQKGKPAFEWKKNAEGGFDVRFNKPNEGGMGGGGDDDKGGEDLVDGDDKGKKDETAGGPGDDPQMQEMMKSMMKGFKMKVSVKLPGAISKTGVTKFDDRTFGIEADDKIFESKEAQKKFEKMDVSASCGKPGAEAEKELAGFKPDLAKAVEEAKKAAAEAKAAGGDEDGKGAGMDGGDDEGDDEEAEEGK